MYNSSYSKTMGNLRNRMDVRRITTNFKDYQKLVST